MCSHEIYSPPSRHIPTWSRLQGNKGQPSEAVASPDGAQCLPCPCPVYPTRLEHRQLTYRPQGCCFSLPRGPNSPYPGGSAPARPQSADLSQSQSQTQAQPPSTRSTGPDHDRAGPHQHRSRHRRRPLDQHINKPLRRNEWSSKNRIWSRAAIDRERTDFFDTRVSGRPEIWQTLHAALDVLWSADIARRNDSNDSSDDSSASLALATAQSILDAADITLPTGNLADGAYDLLGNYYQLPAHIVSDPRNIVSGDEDNDDDRFGEAKAAEDTAGADDDDLDGEDEAERRRMHKGKAVVNVSDQVVAVVRLSNTARDLKLDVGKDESVRSITHRIMEESSVRAPHPSIQQNPASLTQSIFPCAAPLWLPCPTRLHGQNPERQYFTYCSRLDGSGCQRFRLRASTLKVGVGVLRCVDAHPGSAETSLHGSMPVTFMTSGIMWRLPISESV